MKYQTLLSLIQSDAPESGIIFVGEQVQCVLFLNCSTNSLNFIIKHM